MVASSFLAQVHMADIVSSAIEYFGEEFVVGLLSLRAHNFVIDAGFSAIEYSEEELDGSLSRAFSTAVADSLGWLWSAHVTKALPRSWSGCWSLPLH